MEEKNELNDILIKNAEREKGGNMKNILLFAAVTLLVFFIGVLAFKMLSQDEMNQKRAQSMLPEEPTSSMESSFEKEPVGSATSQDALSTYKEILAKNREKQQAAEAEAAKEPEAPSVESVMADKLPPKATTEPEPKVEAPAKPKEVLAEPKVPAKPAKPAKKVKQYYIQVAALSKFEPNKKFLATITGNGYKYKVVSKMINGSMIKRVYVGPYASSKAANKVLADVRDKISDKAFVIKD